MPRIVAISDTHSRHSQITNLPEGDILVHAGDATVRGTFDEVVEFNRWLSTLPHKHKIFVAGNHDWLFEKSASLARTLMTNVHYLQDEFAIIEGLKFYGSPWQPRFFDWAFNLNRGEQLRSKWKLIPHDTDILITHGPPHGILDGVIDRWTGQIELTGCEELLPKVLAIKPRVHIFGHIHSGYGKLWQEGIQFVNASTCNERYEAVNAPLVIDL